ncbi:MAG: exodeoxyribonuclease VII large subunit, partial [Clostridiales bacterium]
VGRGGGSYEDLAAFDTEIVVRAIAACQTPVISAVGHESDFSLADLAADLRATTPSHGAQLAVREKRELLSVLDNLQERLGQLMAWNLKSKRDYLESLAQKTPFLRPQSLLESAERSWQGLFDSLYNKKEVLLNEKENQISVLAARLHLLSPLATLARGYAICSKDDGQIVKSTEDLSLGENISLRLAQGIAQCSVEKLQDNHQ